MLFLSLEDFKTYFQPDLPLPAKAALGRILSGASRGQSVPTKIREEIVHKAYEAANLQHSGGLSSIQQNIVQGSAAQVHVWVYYYWLHRTTPNEPDVAAIDRMLLGGQTFEEVAGRPVVSYPQPPLSFPERRFAAPSGDPEEESRISWLNPTLTDALPFVGRQTELQALDDFFHDERPILFWAVSGPSGTGKTRMIIEWLRGLSERMRASQAGRKANIGFLTMSELEKWRTETDQDWSSWVPDRPTVIVADYLHIFAKDVFALFERARTLASDAAGSSYPVRVLLIDHALPESLRAILRDPRFAGIGNQRFDDGGFDPFFRSRPLQLGFRQQSAKLLFAVMRDAAAFHKGRFDAAEAIAALRQLRRIPGAWCPLFAALRGRALALDHGASFSDRRELIRSYLLSDNRILWTDAQVKSPQYGLWAASAVAAATAVRGLDFEDFARILPVEIDGEQTDIAYVQALARWQVTTHSKITLPALTPDILGEAFFLMMWEETAQRPPHYRAAVIEMIARTNGRAQYQSKTEQLLGFAGRAADNLSNDRLPSVEHHWEALIDFLRPDRFPERSLFRSAAAIGRAHVQERLILLLKTAARSDVEILRRLVLLSIGPDDVAELEAATDSPFCYEATFALVSMYRNAEYVTFDEGKAKALYVGIHYAARNTSIVNRDRITPLFLAAEFGIPFVVFHLLQESPDTIPIARRDGSLPLHAASQSGHAEVIKILLENADVDVNAKTSDGATALALAAQMGHVHVVDILLSHVAIDPNRSSRAGTIPLIQASRNGHVDVVSRLIEDPRVIVNFARLNGITALRASCENGQDAVVRVLLSHPSINPNMIVRNGHAAIHLAAAGGHTETLKLLLRHPRTNVNKTIGGGMTPLTLTARFGHADAAAALLSHSAVRPNRVPKMSLPALHWACANNDLPMVRLFLEHPDIDVNLRDRIIGGTPLIAACGVGNLDIVRHLLADGRVALNARSVNGWTARDYAASVERRDIIEMLEDHERDLR